MRALMTRKSCAVEMRNAILRNYLNYPVFIKKKNNKNSLKINATHILLCDGPKDQCNKSKQVNGPGLTEEKKRRKKHSRVNRGLELRVLSS